MKKKYLLAKYILIVALIFLLLLMSLCIGSAAISVSEVFDTFFGNVTDYTYRDIVINIRFPRALAAFIVGGGLSLSGYCLQTFFRNPIAGPYILGISSGAKLMVAILFVLLAGKKSSSFTLMILASFLGAMLSMQLVLLCAQKVQNMALLLVCGVMIGYICTAVTDFLVTFADDADIVNLHNWSKGSLSGLSWMEVYVMGFVVIVASVLIFLISKPMGAYIMGESYAISLGVNVKAFRALLIALSSLLAATITAFVGPVSFVGIAAPHLVRGLLKETSPKKLIPACFLFGGAFCMLCDLIARQIFSPLELSISTVTAVFGAPIVIYMLIKKKVGR